MKQCKICLGADSCSFDWRDPDCEYMNCTEFKKPPPTNADRIRGKDDEGLAEFIYSEMFLIPWCDMGCGNVEEPPCRKCVLKWLKQEVSDV